MHDKPSKGVSEMVEVPRDRYGRPLIYPPGGGTPVPYLRASSFGDVLEDTTNLTKWKIRMAVKGVAQRQDLHLAAAVTSLEERGRLNGIAEQAIEHAGGSRASSIGTSLHTLTELFDRGEPLPPVASAFDGDLDAYAVATQDFDFKAGHIEQFVVCDELQVAGTPDRIARHAVDLWFAEGLCLAPALRIGDLKTGGDSRYLGRHAVQLAIYAHSSVYDPASGERTALTDVAVDFGVVFHMPAAAGRCDLYALDLEQGWQGALLAADVRAWRKRKGLAVAA